MKYLVMECHQAYAVLMDEDSRFVNAANLNYTVGQTVTDPVLLGDMSPDRKSLISRSVMVRITAAAACLALVCMGGYGYYSRNIATSSVVVISSGADIEMHLNSRGEVVSLESNSPSGQEIISRFNQTHKHGGTQSDVASALLEFQLEEGIISSGDTVSVYTQSGDESKIDDLINDLETDLPKLKIDNKNTDKRGGSIQPVTPPSPEIRSNETPVTTSVHSKPAVDAPETTVSAVIQKPDHQIKTEAVAPEPPLQQTTPPPTTEDAAPEHTRPEPPQRSTENPPPPPPQSHGTRPVQGHEVTPETGTVAVPVAPAETHTKPAQPEVPDIETPTELPPVTAPASPEVQQQTPDKKVHPTPKPEERLPEIAEPPLPENPAGQEFPELQEAENSAKPLHEPENPMWKDSDTLS